MTAVLRSGDRSKRQLCAVLPAGWARVCRFQGADVESENKRLEIISPPAEGT